MKLLLKPSLRGYHSDALVLSFFDHQKPNDHPFWTSFPAPVKTVLKTWLGKKDITLDWGATHVLHLPLLKQAVVILGFGKKKDWTLRRHRLSSRRIARLAQQHRWTNVTIPMQKADAEALSALAENLVLANYEFRTWKKEPKIGWPHLHTVTIAMRDAVTKDLNAAVKRGQTIADATNMIRDYANTPGGVMTPALLAIEAQAAAKTYGLACRVLNKQQMAKIGMNALLGVANGSNEEPKFIILEYRGGDHPGATRHPSSHRGGDVIDVAFVGKGVTFDSGGLNLKPGNAMHEMHMDMAGGAAVIGAMAAIAMLKLPLNVVAVIPAVENMPSGSGVRPGDLLTSLSGKTIEVSNTDAEGRVILADALTYVEREFKPKLKVDVATLTGAALVALGQEATALFTQSEELRTAGVAIGEASGDYVWPLPMWEEYAPLIKGTFGDVTNSGKSKWGGAIEGAMFLAEFVGDKSWIHLDIAPTMSSVEGQQLAAGATGVGVRWLVELATRISDGTLKKMNADE